jgi:hypothetical protein
VRCANLFCPFRVFTTPSPFKVQLAHSGAGDRSQTFLSFEGSGFQTNNVLGLFARTALSMLTTMDRRCWRVKFSKRVRSFLVIGMCSLLFGSHTHTHSPAAPWWWQCTNARNTISDLIPFTLYVMLCRLDQPVSFCDAL